ncbi:MAG: DUF5009 domain-containing protein [Lewinellaceae bacterium]|nr:DUF5009 domain-containing protein [Lewinellaceae bacterium]MCB9287386.1 DUF5009 domain-containing protein [Lewinellaceae bacterium]
MSTQRILSVDIFRGLTIFMMLFVNELAGVSDIPKWMKHVPAGVDGMTFVDVVFPAFLFIVGMAIPFAVENREAKGQGQAGFWQHVLVRTLGLVILGVYMVNSAEMNREANLIPHGWWAASLYIAAILIWNRYPSTGDVRKKRLFAGFRIAGAILLVVLFFLYRKGTDGQLTGMTPSWWGILGLIGWAYLLSMVFYMASQKKLPALLGVFAALLALILVLRGGLSGLPAWGQWLRGQSGHLVHTLIVLSGIICSLILAKDGVWHQPVAKIRNILLFGILLGVAGFLTRPFGGISKIAATPGWALFSAASCCLIFPAIYWLADLKGIKSWANFLKPAGENPLLAYILPPLFYAIAGFSFFPAVLSSGVPGMLRALVFTLAILWITQWLTKKGVRLHL